MMATYQEQMNMAAMGAQARWQGLTLRDLMGKVDQFPFLQAEDCKPGLKGEEWPAVNPQAAFLGPQIWEKKLPMSALEETPWEGYSGPHRYPQGQATSPPQGTKVEAFQGYSQQAFPGMVPQFSQGSAEMKPPSGNLASFEAMDTDLALASVPGQDFDPKNRVFSPEELKPQPTIRKRSKTFTPPEKKDIKYWEKRGKNNVAARRSREARRLKENQIALRAAYLEKQNVNLRVTLKNLNVENANIKVSVEALMMRIKKREAEVESKVNK